MTNLLFAVRRTFVTCRRGQERDRRKTTVQLSLLGNQCLALHGKSNVAVSRTILLLDRIVHKLNTFLRSHPNDREFTVAVPLTGAELEVNVPGKACQERCCYQYTCVCAYARVCFCACVCV